MTHQTRSGLKNKAKFFIVNRLFRLVRLIGFEGKGVRSQPCLMIGLENQARDRKRSIVYAKKRYLNERNTFSEILAQFNNAPLVGEVLINLFIF